MAETPGKVVETYEEFFDTEPPVLWKVTIDGVECWHARHPGQVEGQCSNTGGLLLGPTPPASGHVVEENDDGTITVRPNPPSDPSNSNSILCPMCGWHGYIADNVWRSL